MDNWIECSEKLPDGDFVTYFEGNYYLGHSNWLHGLADKDGIYMPARYGAGIRVECYLPLTPPTIKGGDDD